MNDQDTEYRTHMSFTVTDRGFRLISFGDRYNQKCTIQKSSLAFVDAIWFGVEGPNPVILATDAAKHGIKTDQTTGWIKYPIPDDVLISTRMHLTRQDVQDLLPILQHFAKTGELPTEEQMKQ